ncbi:MAG: CDP-glycerol glycerophosphotransferase family protein [Coprobacillus cateniformis]|uniref:CDP-glycerol glycerophosphotransferase family protein n=1 Tax=Coprobacillus cateniformis TaxID=100884 RepID=UPI0039A36DC6
MSYLRKIKTLMNWVTFYIIGCVFSLVYPVQKNKVCFLSDVRSVMGGNLKCVYDYLEDKDYERVIEFKADRRVRRSLKSKIKLVFNLATSKYILLDDFANAITFMKVRKGQEIVQLWHGPGAFKRFGWSRKLNGEDIGHIHSGYKKYTMATVSGKGIRWCYAEAFSIDENKIKATGFPRTDDFFNAQYIEQTKQQFYNEYPELKNKKIILFAPTYRGTKVNEASYDFSQIDFAKLYEQFHDEYVFILKWHPALYNNISMGVVEAPDLSQYGDFYRDFSKYRDINDLLIVSECLITDYSSMIFDYVLLNKPIIYFTYDLQEYTSFGGRGLYFDFNEYVYGEVANTQDELLNAIRSGALMMDKRKIFYDKFMGECDGHATEKTCRCIFGE